jgi:hypothetical protein
MNVRRSRLKKEPSAYKGGEGSPDRFLKGLHARVKAFAKLSGHARRQNAQGEGLSGK